MAGSIVTDNRSFPTWRRNRSSGQFGDAAIDGKSIAQPIKGEPLFSPVEGLDESVWQGKNCDGCNRWNGA